jgi:hypothetical protein
VVADDEDEIADQGIHQIESTKPDGVTGEERTKKRASMTPNMMQ